MVGFILSALEVVMSVVVLKLFTNEDQDKPVSSGVQTFARSFLARLSCTACGSMTSRVTSRKADEVADNNNSSVVNVHKVKGKASTKVMAFEEATKLELENTDADGSENEVLYTWRDISRMVDFICLYFFAFATFAYTTVFILVLQSS